MRMGRVRGAPGSTGRHDGRMRAVQVVPLTGPSDVEVREVDPPTQGPDDVLVEVHSVGVAFPDLLLSRGEYQFKPEPPFTLGVDFAGVVLDPGSPESSAFAVGQRVAGVNLNGGAAEQVANPAIFTFPLPDAMSYDEGAALPMNYLTALFALEERGACARARRSSSTAPQAGSAPPPCRSPRGLGARTIAVVSTEEKAAFARAAGADDAVVGPTSRTPSRSSPAGAGSTSSSTWWAATPSPTPCAASPSRAGSWSSASPPGRASRRSRSTGCCSPTPTSAASAGARTR